MSVKQFCDKHIRKDCLLSSVMTTLFGLEMGSPGFQRGLLCQLFNYIILDKFLDDPKFFVSLFKTNRAKEHLCSYFWVHSGS